MIPVRDLLPTRRRPVLTWALIALNAVVFVYELVLEPDALEQLVHLWGLVPLRFVEALDGSDPQALLTPLSSMFLHGSWLHVIGNLWFLQVFGDNVEDDLGRGRYLLLYVATGLAAVAAQMVADPTSKLPMVGASGAISGVLGAYLVLHPRARVVTLVPIVIFFHLMELPAGVFVLVWFAMQLVNAFGVLGGAGGGGVAWFARLGGFLAGLVLAYALLPRQRAKKPAPRRASSR